MKDPAILLYTSDFLTETYFLNMHERGQFITLVCLQQQHGHLSWPLIKQTVGPLSDQVLALLKRDEDDRFYNERTDLEIERRRQYSARQAENARKRWTKGSDAGAVPLGKETETEREREKEKEKETGTETGTGVRGAAFFRGDTRPR